MSAVISRIGAEAGLAADYWRDGIFVYETGTGSRALIEQQRTVGWQGRVKIQTQRGQAKLLLQRLTTLIGQEQRRIGITPTGQAVAMAPVAGLARDLKGEDTRETIQLLRFAQEPSTKPEYFVSCMGRQDARRFKARRSC